MYLLHALALAHEAQPPTGGLGARSADLLFLKLRNLFPLYELLLEIMLGINISFSTMIVLGNAHHPSGKRLLALRELVHSLGGFIQVAREVLPL